jgi:two-component system, OmpR family, response regulator VicR
VLKRILFVDDDFAVAEVTRMVLEHEGFAVIVAANGEDAFKAVESERPDLVITDFMMPLMNGGELVRRLRGDPGLAHIPVIMITASSMSELEGHELCTLVLSKPITVDELLEAIHKVLG